MKVLIIGPRFHYFNQSIERAFRALGYETRVLAYDNPVHPYDAVNKVRYKLTADKLRMKRESRALFHLEAELAFEEYQPDVVFVMNGDMLLPDTLLHWRGQMEDDPQPVEHSAKVALWFFDSFTHIPLCEDNIPAVDAVFCYEQTDLPLIREKYGVEAHFLPQAVDTELYHPLNDNARQEEIPNSSLLTPHYHYDLVFAGDIFHSQKRREVIQAVVTHYPQLRMRVWGEYKPWYKNPWQWLKRERKDVYMNRNASAEELNRDYNLSRIVLNVHIEQQKDGANPKVYEIAASGAYQICDANPYVRQLFLNGEVGFYTLDASPEHRYDSLFACIDYALAHEMSEQARAAYQVVTQNHTFEQRIKLVMEVLGVKLVEQA